MLFCFFILLCFHALGEVLSRFLPILIPGPVLGMALLLICLVRFPRLLQKIEHSAMALLQHFSLLFIPAGVGIMVSHAVLGGAWLAILTSMIISTLLTMLVVAVCFQYFQPHSGHRVNGVADLNGDLHDDQA